MLRNSDEPLSLLLIALMMLPGVRSLQVAQAFKRPMRAPDMAPCVLRRGQRMLTRSMRRRSAGMTP